MANKQNITINNVVGGELSPKMFGRVDIPVYQKGLNICQNFLVFPQGGATYRQAFVFVKMTNGNQKAVFIPFQFNNSQSYLLEFTAGSFTIYHNNGVVLNPASNITAITKANPGVFTTSAAHSLAVNDEVSISGILGMSEISGFYQVNTVPSATTFTLKNIFGTPIDTTNFTTYVSGGTTSKVFKVAHTYAEADLENLKYAQTGDTLFISHNNYRTQIIQRVSDLSWTFAAHTTSGGTGINTTTSNTWPRAVCFTPDSRLILAGTSLKPETVWGSKTPSQSSGNTQFSNFGAPSVIDDIRASDGYVYTLASTTGKIDYIEWVSNTPKALVIGTQGSVRRMYGEVEGASPNPLAVNARSVNTYGVDKAIPVAVGSSFFYIERGAQRIRNLNYDFQIDAYDTTDMNLASDHISKNVKQIVFQNATPDVLWGVRQDGKLIGLSYQERENVAGWHRHNLGGSHTDANSVVQPYAKALYLGIMGRATKGEQIWAIVERKVGNNTVRSVEYMADEPTFPVFSDFYTGNKTSDENKFRDATYEVQKTSTHLDSAAIYDGTVNTGTCTVSAVSGTGITITSSVAIFTSAMIGREVWKKFDSNGNGTGKAVITGFTSSTQVTATVVENFDSTTVIPAGRWALTADKLYNIYWLEGQTVGVTLDGGVSQDVTVTNGQATLPKQASRIVIGYKYLGLIASLSLDFGGSTGSAQNKPRKINKAYVDFLNTIGARIGTDLYNLERLNFPTGVLNRGTPMQSRRFRKNLFDKTSDDPKHMYIMQDNPLPCTVLSMDLFGETSDD